MPNPTAIKPIHEAIQQYPEVGLLNAHEQNELTKKPFPWRCTNCREKSVREAVVDYVATRVYDGIEYTVHMDGLKTPKCESCGQVAPDAEALELIERAFTIEREHQADALKSA